MRPTSSPPPIRRERTVSTSSSLPFPSRSPEEEPPPELTLEVVRGTAFADNGDEINSTVGRAHATVFFDEEKGDYRIADEASRYGTRIFRENRSIEVPPGKSSGVKLRPGDEIYLGRASLTFRLSG